jgi:uncharacterized protein YydD (DUF2326 family)
VKLTRLYSNRPKVFLPVDFREGLNVILGSIRRPEHRDADTHNLGKSLLAQVVDFALLKKRDPAFFLIKLDVFSEFVFFLELETHTGKHVTIRRSVAEVSKAAFMLHDQPRADFSDAPEEAWSHWRVPFEKSRQLLDGVLDLTGVRPWSYRNAIAYSLRTQNDFDEPFRLSKYAGKHADWKPFLAHVLGLDGRLVERGYGIETELGKLAADEARLKVACGDAASSDEVRGLVQIIDRDVAALTREIDAFDLAPVDARTTEDLVENIDRRIASLNDERYLLAQQRARITDALGVRVTLDLGALERIFAESKLYFGDQIKRDYAALAEFNRVLAEERDGYLRQDLQEIDVRLADLGAELNGLNDRRADSLRSLSDGDALHKYKRLTKQLAEKQAELTAAQGRQAAVDELIAVRRKILTKHGELDTTRAALEAVVASAPARYEEVRGHFDEIVHRVIGYHANLYTRFNTEGHIEFDVGLVDAEGKPTKAGEGFSYTRLMCVAFDMALMRAHLHDAYPHFIYHDGVLETLDDRKKLNLIDVIRDYAALGVQHVVTMIESELPVDATGGRFAFDDDEIVLRLHDEGDDGRLFKMPAW